MVVGTRHVFLRNNEGECYPARSFAFSAPLPSCIIIIRAAANFLVPAFSMLFRLLKSFPFFSHVIVEKEIKDRVDDCREFILVNKSLRRKKNVL